MSSDDMKKLGDQVLGELASGELELIGDYDWRAIFYDPAGELYRTMNPSGAGYATPPQAANAYWQAQRAANPSTSLAQQRLAASQQLQAVSRPYESSAMMRRRSRSAPSARAWM